MFDFINRIRNFDIRKITPVQMVIGVIAIVLVLAVLNFLLNLANMLLPIILVGVVLYGGYSILNSRADNQSKAEAVSAPTKDAEIEARRDQAVARVADEKPVERKMEVAPKINPNTGLEEADLEQLLAKEKRLMEQTKQVNSDVAAQLEARRKRLINDQE